MTDRNLRKDWLVTRAEFAERHDEYFVHHGTMRMRMDRPTMPNVQEPHEQDELYLIISGSGRFVKAGEERAFSAGDAIFAEAGCEHHFAEITPDMRMWILYWGPDGGEKEHTDAD